MKRQKQHSDILSKLPDSTFKPLIMELDKKLGFLASNSKESEKNDYDMKAGLILHKFFHKKLGIADDKAILADIKFWQWLNRKLANLTKARWPKNQNVRMGIVLTDRRKINFRNQYEYVSILHDNNLPNPYEYAEIVIMYDMKYSTVVSTNTLRKNNKLIMQAFVEAVGRPNGNDTKMQREEMRKIVGKINSNRKLFNSFTGKSRRQCYQILQNLRNPTKKPMKIPVKNPQKSKSGFVYIVSQNNIVNDNRDRLLLKIGETQNAIKRAKDLSTSGVPGEYEIIFCIPSDDCKKLEKAVHEKLKKYRPKNNREFFDVEVNIAIDTIMELR